MIEKNTEPLQLLNLDFLFLERVDQLHLLVDLLVRHFDLHILKILANGRRLMLQDPKEEVVERSECDEGEEHAPNKHEDHHLIAVRNLVLIHQLILILYREAALRAVFGSKLFRGVDDGRSKNESAVRLDHCVHFVLQSVNDILRTLLGQTQANLDLTGNGVHLNVHDSILGLAAH